MTAETATASAAASSGLWSFVLGHPFLSLIFVVVLLVVLYDVYKKRKYAGLHLPPQSSGLIPFIGAGISFAGGPLQYATKMYKEKGEIFTLNMFGQRLTFLVGPDAHAPFFSKNDTEISQDEPYKFSVPIFGKGVVYDADVHTRNQQLKFIAQSLNSKALASYVPLIVKEAEDFFDKWGDSGTVDIRDSLSQLIILTASRCLMGKEIRENLFNDVARLYQTLDEGLTPISVFFPYLPIPAHKRRDQAREAMVEMFRNIIAERKKNPDVKHDDVLQVFMDAKYRDKTGLSDAQIAGLMIALLFAGQHTSSVTGSWTGLLLLQPESQKKYLPAVMKEQEDVLKEYNGELTIDALNKMERLHKCVKEALRMYPPLIFVMRQVLQPFKFKEYDIPAGDVLFLSPALSMRLPDVYENPDDYNPERADPELVRKYSYLGFGSGRHACMGENFAYLQIKTIWSVLLRNFDMETVGPLPVPDYKAMVVGPTHPCLVRYKRKTPTAK